MSAHLSTEQLEDYSKRALPAASLVAADKHLAACHACRARLGEAGDTGAAASMRAGLLGSDLDSAHIAYDIMERYVDGGADRVDREIVESHVGFCRQCAIELNDLRSFAAQMAESRAHKSVAVTDEARHKTGWLKRVFGLGSQRSPGLIAALAAVILVAVAAPVLIILLGRSGETGSRATATRTGPSASNTGAEVAARKDDRRNAEVKNSGLPANPGIPAPINPTDHTRGLTRQPTLSSDATALTLTLAAGEAETFELPLTVRSLHLLLKGLEEGGSKNYSVKLSESSGALVWQQDFVKIRDDLFITVPAEKLADGQYLVTATPEGGRAASFPITVIRR
jgi:predicted anti-sigma-YlaC factor YlaD